MGNILTLTPPLTITKPEMDQALDILDECLAEVMPDLPARPPGHPGD